MTDDALMRWEWEGGTPDPGSEEAAAKWSSTANRRRHERRVQVIAPVAPPAESGPASV